MFFTRPVTPNVTHWSHSIDGVRLIVISAVAARVDDLLHHRIDDDLS
jgi:hypothetical protein